MGTAILPVGLAFRLGPVIHSWFAYSAGCLAS